MDILDDINLEKENVIKPINTLDIICKAENIKKKRTSRIKTILMIIIITLTFVAQTLYYMLFKDFFIVLLPMTLYVITLFILLIVFYIKGGTKSCY